LITQSLQKKIFLIYPHSAPMKSKTLQSISANLKMANAMVKASKFGKMAQFTKAIGEMAKLMDMEELSTQMVTSTSVIGKMIRLRAKVNICTQMGPGMTENGSMTVNKAKAMKHGQMEPFLKVSIMRARNMDSANFCGPTSQNMKDNFLTMRSMVEAPIPGLMAGCMSATGK